MITKGLLMQAESVHAESLEGSTGPAGGRSCRRRGKRREAKITAASLNRLRRPNSALSGYTTGWQPRGGSLFVAQVASPEL